MGTGAPLSQGKQHEGRVTVLFPPIRHSRNKHQQGLVRRTGGCLLAGTSQPLALGKTRWARPGALTRARSAYVLPSLPPGPAHVVDAQRRCEEVSRLSAVGKDTSWSFRLIKKVLEDRKIERKLQMAAEDPV